MARKRAEVLGELKALASLQQDDRRQLASVERHEMALVERFDAVLEELTALHVAEERAELEAIAEALVDGRTVAG